MAGEKNSSQKNSRIVNPKETLGGQAILEGVMLRKANQYTTAVRSPKGNIIVDKTPIPNRRTGFLKIFKLPILRGIYALFEMLTIGVKTLIHSAQVAGKEDEEDGELSSAEIAWLIITSFGITIGVFVILPYFLTYLIGVEENTQPILFNIIDAAIKIVFFLGYVLAISRMDDIKRLFEYHGAEHKVVACWEQEGAVSIEGARKYSRLHPRCGSSFIVLVAVISIIFFSFIPLLFIGGEFSQLSGIMQKAILLCSRILIIPLIAGVSFEVLKLAGKYYHIWFFKAVSAPGLALQLITTSEPDDSQLEVAVAAALPLINKGTKNKKKKSSKKSSKKQSKKSKRSSSSAKKK